MIPLLATLLAIGISALWIFPVIKALKKRQILKPRDYVFTALVPGFVYTCLLIIVTEIIWDRIAALTPLSGLMYDITASFLRAALLEETFKLTGFLIAKKKLKPVRRIDMVLIAAVIGAMYGIVEKAVSGNIVSVIIGLVIPNHITWQMERGYRWYNYEKAKEQNDRKRMFLEWFLAVPMIYIHHGLWDTALDVSGWLMEREEGFAGPLAAVLLILTIGWGIFYTIWILKKMIREAKNTRLPEGEKIQEAAATGSVQDEAAQNEPVQEQQE